MSGYLLHQGATVQCLHGGSASPATSIQQVTVGGQPVTVQSSVYTVSSCSNTLGGNPYPCTTAQWVTAATRVTCNGQPVLLADSQATCVPTGATATIASTQTRVKGI
jgi:uncharacterized Zn-binding protein involved in type VI secretion